MPADARDLLRRIRQRPFEPFRLVMNDGQVHDFRTPYNVIVTFQRLVVGIPDVNQPHLAATCRDIFLDTVDRVETLQPVQN